jgi:LacI family transcriptional regulator
MKQAAAHLRELGHTDVGMVVGGPRRPSRERRAGVLDVFGRRGDGHCEVLEGDFSIDFGYAATRRFIERAERPTALIVGGNILMHGALRAVHETGVEIGRDLSFVGCDDVAVAEFHDPPIAVVRRSPRDGGSRPAEMMLALLADASPDEQVVLPTEFVPAASCAAPAR